MRVSFYCTIFRYCVAIAPMWFLYLNSVNKSQLHNPLIDTDWLWRQLLQAFLKAHHHRVRTLLPYILDNLYSNTFVAGA
jgi:hypothetical protein